MANLEPDEKTISQIMSKLPEFVNLESLGIEQLRYQIRHKISKILQEYYQENTQLKSNVWITKFQKYGISEDDGKLAISCARRLGFEIS